MTTSESVDKIFPAFIKAQAETGAAKKSSDNPFFKSNYADLAEIIETSKDALIKNDLGIIQSPSANGSAVSVTCRIVHASGQWIEDTITLTATKSDPQAMGTAITYGRRYQLAAMLNIAQEDDDGNKASEPVKIHTVNPDLEKMTRDLTDWMQFDPPIFNAVQILWAEKQIAEKNVDGMRTAIAKAVDLSKAIIGARA